MAGFCHCSRALFLPDGGKHTPHRVNIQRLFYHASCFSLFLPRHTPRTLLQGGPHDPLPRQQLERPRLRGEEDRWITSIVGRANNASARGGLGGDHVLHWNVKRKPVLNNTEIPANARTKSAA